MSSGPAHLKKVMTEIVENKCVQVERLREKLRSANFAESTYNDTLGAAKQIWFSQKGDNDVFFFSYSNWGFNEQLYMLYRQIPR